MQTIRHPEHMNNTTIDEVEKPLKVWNNIISPSKENTTEWSSG